jgi:hypothetical protein
MCHLKMTHVTRIKIEMILTNAKLTLKSLSKRTQYFTIMTLQNEFDKLATSVTKLNKLNTS